MQDPNKKVRGKRLTQEDIIERFILVHGNYYDYSKVIFTTNNEPVIIICPRHGEFYTTPKRHGNGAKCRKCFLEDTNGKYHKDETFRKMLSDRMKNSQDKLRQGMLNKYGVDNASKVYSIMESKRKYFQSKYGVDNPFQVEIESRIKKMIDTKIENGTWINPEDLSEFVKYKKLVWKFTDQSIVNFDAYWLLENRSINGNHIDHIYSIKDGFDNGIDPSIIGHISNLQSLSAYNNRSKNSSSWITIDQLLKKIKEIENGDNH